MLYLVFLALKTAPTSSSLVTAVTVSERGQAGPEVSVRLAGTLLAEELADTDRALLVCSLAILGREEDSLAVWRLHCLYFTPK